MSWCPSSYYVADLTIIASIKIMGSKCASTKVSFHRTNPTKK